MSIYKLQCIPQPTVRGALLCRSISCYVLSDMNLSTYTVTAARTQKINCELNRAVFCMFKLYIQTFTTGCSFDLRCTFILFDNSMHAKTVSNVQQHDL